MQSSAYLCVIDFSSHSTVAAVQGGDIAQVAVIGASGYSGAELLRILARHPRVEVALACANASAGEEIATIHPDLRGIVGGRFSPVDLNAAGSCDVVLLALPAGESMKLVPDLLASGVRVVDLAGDFRFRDAAEYEAAYGRTHAAPDLLAEAVYGLVEWDRERIAGARLVASPGCYPTATLLPLLPLLRAGLIEPMGITVAAMSGTTGAGRSGSAAFSMSEMGGNARPYRVGNHQHVPEILQAVGRFAGIPAEITFVPHLLPVPRGILATATATPAPGVDAAALQRALVDAYGSEPFVRVLDDALPELRSVVGTSWIEMAVRVDGSSGRAVLLSAIDNLRKGAASQAVQSMNIMLGYPETLGLL